MKTAEAPQDLVTPYLQFLEHARIPEETDTFALPDENPYEDAWESIDELLSTTPDAAWPLLLEIVERCDDRDLGMFGAGALATLLFRHPAKFADRFEKEIRANDRFLRAFQYTTMSGVPLAIQQQLNAAQRDRGVDPKFIVEYDEEIEENG